MIVTLCDGQSRSSRPRSICSDPIINAPAGIRTNFNGFAPEGKPGKLTVMVSPPSLILVIGVETGSGVLVVVLVGIDVGGTDTEIGIEVGENDGCGVDVGLGRDEPVSGEVQATRNPLYMFLKLW